MGVAFGALVKCDPVGGGVRTAGGGEGDSDFDIWVPVSL